MPSLFFSSMPPKSEPRVGEPMEAGPRDSGFSWAIRNSSSVDWGSSMRGISRGGSAGQRFGMFSVGAEPVLGSPLGDSAGGVEMISMLVLEAGVGGATLDATGCGGVRQATAAASASTAVIAAIGPRIRAFVNATQAFLMKYRPSASETSSFEAFQEERADGAPRPPPLQHAAAPARLLRALARFLRAPARRGPALVPPSRALARS